MKKKYLILAGILVLGLAAAGCGKKKESEDEQLPVTVAPVEEDKKSDNLVDMQKTTEEDIKNVMGEKTAASSQLIITNKTGDSIAAIYIRPNTDDDDEEWGDDLVNGMFILKNGDKAVYYYEKGSSSLYDIRITYEDEDRNECFFRKLPLTTISQISLCMDGTGEDAIPYATYMSGNSKKETSTLKEVKQRLGLLDDDEDDDDSSDDTNKTTTTAQPTQAPAATQTPAVTATPAPQNPDNPENPDPADNTMANTAAGYIGQSLENLIGACGEPSGSDYEDEPESGETGYHYYETDEGSFTVSTTVDEDGNEVVTGVW